MPAQVSRFALMFEVDGNWENALEKLPSLFENASSAADGMAVHVSDSAQKTETAMKALEKVKGFGEKMMEGGLKYFEGMGEFIQEGMKSLMPLETTMQRIKGLTGVSSEATAEIVENALELAERTPFESQDIIDMTGALAIAKVNLGAFRDTMTGTEASLADMAKQGFAKVNNDILEFAGNMKITSASVIADVATMAGMSGERMKLFVRGMSRALSTGNLGIIRDDLPDAFRQAIFKTTGNKSLVTAQQAMDNLFKFLKDKGQIGAATAASDTMEAYITGFKEMKEVLFRKIFGMPNDPNGFYERFKKILSGIYTDISKAFNDPALLASVKGFFEPALELAEWLGKTIRKASVAVLGFIKEHPKLMKFLGWASMAVAAVMVVVGGIITLVATIGILGLAIPAAFSGFMTVVAAVGIPLLKIVAIIGAITAASAALYAAVQSNWGGIGDIFEGIKTTLSGISEGLSSMTRESYEMSEETAKALAKMGLLDFVLDLLDIGHMVYVFFADIKAGFDSAFADTAPALEELSQAFEFLFEQIKTLFVTVGKLIGANFSLKTSFSENSTAGAYLGVMLGTLVGGIARVVEFAVLLVAGFVKVVTWVVEAARVFDAFINPLSMILDYFQGIYKAWGLLMDGKFLSFFEQVGLTLLNGVLSPIQLLIRGLTALLELAGQDVPEAMKNIAKYGFRSLIEGAPKDTRVLPEDLRPGYVDPYEGVSPENKAKLIQMKEFEAAKMSFAPEPEALPMKMQSISMEDLDREMALRRAWDAKTGGELTPGSGWKSSDMQPPAMDMALAMVPQRNLQQRSMASDQLDYMQAGQQQQSVAAPPVNVTNENKVMVNVSADASGFNAWLDNDRNKSMSRVGG